MTRMEVRRDSSRSVEQMLSQDQLYLDEKGYVCWETSHSDHPRSWSTCKKLVNFSIVVWLEFFMTAISTSGTTAAQAASKEYGVSTTLGYFAFTTIYLIGQTIGGVLCSPISETFGRRALYIASCVVYCIFNVIIATVPSIVVITLARFVCGFVSAIPTNVAFGSMEDTYDWQARIWILYWFTSISLSALAIGPIFAVAVEQNVGWHWIFYIAAIASGVSVILSLMLKESRGTVLLDARLAKMKPDPGIVLQTESSMEKLSLHSFARECCYRPIQLLVQEPLIIFCAALCAIGYGLIYGLTEAITIVYGPSGFGFSKQDASLAFIAVGLGMFLDCMPRFYDANLFKRYLHEGRVMVPESKIRSFAVAYPALVIGLWLFAWTIPPLVTNFDWAVSMVGLVLVGFATNDFEYVLFGYITDSYPSFAASASSALTLGRTLVASTFPLFTTRMYTTLGANWATTVYAGFATVFLFTPVLFLKYGGKIRHRSSWAVKDDEFRKLSSASTVREPTGNNSA